MGWAIMLQSLAVLGPPPPGPKCALFQSLQPFICHMSVLWWAHWLFLFVVGGSAWATTQGMFGDICAPVFEMFYPSFGIASACAGMSTCTMNLWVYLSWFPPQLEILSLHIAKTCSHQPFSHSEIWCDWGRQYNFHPGTRQQVEVVIVYRTLLYCLQSVHISITFMTSDLSILSIQPVLVTQVKITCIMNLHYWLLMHT
jgi:hypothetical protein